MYVTSPAVDFPLDSDADRDQQDREYLQPIVREIEAELQERDDLNSMVIRKRSQK